MSDELDDFEAAPAEERGEGERDASDDEQPRRRRRPWRWLPWLWVSGLVVMVFGLYFGAHFPQAWFVSAVRALVRTMASELVHQLQESGLLSFL